MQIEIERNSSIPIYIQIANKIRDMIINDYLPEGYKLPPERKLAAQLHINRSTVFNAYNELKADGLLDSCVGQGTIVKLFQYGKNATEFTKPAAFEWNHFLSHSASQIKQAVSIDIMEIANRNDIISFAAGIANSELDPINDYKYIQEDLIENHRNDIFSITPTEGILELRESIQNFISERLIYSKIDEIMVLSGSQQGIEFTAKVLINPGDIVIVEEPTFFGALQVFKSLGARVISIPIDKNGMRTDVLESLLKRYKPVLIYTMPTFQNPTGVVMSLERRKHLLNLAYKYQVPILEDDSYHVLRYEGEHIPPIKAIDSYGYVIYISSFSKIMFQGLRVGWMVAPPAFIEQISRLKQMCDLHSSSLPQWILDSFYRKGLMKKHIEVLKSNYSSRRNEMLKALEANSVKGVEWNIPKGGLYIWCKLPKGINMQALILKALSEKIAFLPSYTCFTENHADQYIRLNFSFNPPELINEGISKLMNAIDSTLNEYPKMDTPLKVEIKPIL